MLNQKIMMVQVNDHQTLLRASISIFLVAQNRLKLLEFLCLTVRTKNGFFACPYESLSCDCQKPLPKLYYSLKICISLVMKTLCFYFTITLYINVANICNFSLSLSTFNVPGYVPTMLFYRFILSSVCPEELGKSTISSVPINEMKPLLVCVISHYVGT